MYLFFENNETKKSFYKYDDSLHDLLTQYGHCTQSLIDDFDQF